MTTRLFACTDCKKYIDAGKRWCFTHLEQPALVEAGQAVDVDRIFATTSYWDTGDSAVGWLNTLLPQVRAFLLTHRTHRILFGKPGDDDFEPDDPHEVLLWDDVAAGEPFDISAATLVSAGCNHWADVEKYMRQREFPVWWWGQPDLMTTARLRFESHVNRSKD
jgi:hypothetical protein